MMNIDELEEAAKDAEQGNAQALHKLIFTNLFTSRNDQEAEKWIQLAVKQGRANVLYSMGVLAIGFKREEVAAKVIRLAAELGHPEAQNDMGVAYTDGDEWGLAKNPCEAHEWFRKAAEQGCANGQFNLGNDYYYGRGVAKDLSQAKWWWGKAANQGHESARNNLNAATRERESSSSSSSSSSSKDGCCYIATAVYGSYDAPEVLCLRQFRDETLSASLFGRLFIRLYYFLSPPIARRLKNTRRANAIARRMLDAFIQRCLHNRKKPGESDDNLS